MSKDDDRSGDRRARGPERAGALLASRIRAAGESRGFAVSRLLTHWAEIAGEDVARVTEPVEVSYGKGFGAYNAISRVRITQTARSGFAERRAAFAHKLPDPSPEVTEAAHRTVEGVADDTLRAALEALGRNILSTHRTT
ncbi:MAG: DUF721 domain-containing protein [Rhodobacteraceae bacterium]|nr:DUF721 domain-containing protein [Paracoccaceae bacterium]